MQMPGGSRSGRVRAPGRKTVVFFQSQICDGEPGSQRFGHIADVPWLVRDAGDLLFAFGIPEDKTIERSVLFQPAAFSCCGKPFGELHMDGRAGYIQSKSALVLTCSWLCNERTSCKKLLLSLVGTISGNCPQVQTASVTGMEKLGSGFCSLILQKPLRISRCCFKWKSDIDKMFRHKGFRQRMLPTDQPGIKFSVQ